MLTAEYFNKLIGERRTLLEMQKMDICCLECRKKIYKKIAEIQEYLEEGAEYGIVTPS